MSLPPVMQITGRAIPVPGDDIDTDRIIPARFMRCITFDGLGEYAFFDARFTESGEKKDHPMNDEKYARASILITGANFGCGSSREHAPQSLYRFGIKAILGESFAEIFFGNSTTLGMPCLNLDRAALNEITAMIQKDPSLEVTIDVENLEVKVGDKVFPATLDSTAQQALVGGKWDSIAELLETDPASVSDRAKSLGYAMG